MVSIIRILKYIRIYYGVKYTGIMENQTEKNMEHEMETGKYLIQGGIQGRSMVYKRIHIGA